MAPDGDPLMRDDTSRPEVPVLRKRHDEPHRAARPLFALLELMAHVQVKVAKAPLCAAMKRALPPSSHPLRLLGLGPDPTRVMRWRSGKSPRRCLRRAAETRRFGLPLTLLDDSVSALQRTAWCSISGALGRARQEVSERRL